MGMSHVAALMGISRVAAYIIASNHKNIECSYSKSSEEDGKYLGWIKFDESKNYRPLINTDACYTSAKEAVEVMKELVEDTIRFVEEDAINGGKDPIIEHVLENQHSPIIRKLANKNHQGQN